MLFTTLPSSLTRGVGRLGGGLRFTENRHTTHEAEEKQTNKQPTLISLHTTLPHYNSDHTVNMMEDKT